MVSLFDDVDHTQHEIGFSEADVRPAAAKTGHTDLRTFTDKLLFRKLKGGEPAWETRGAAFDFTAGSGHTGTGSLWLKAIHIPAQDVVKGVYFHLLERRASGAGRETLVAHLRANATAGPDAPDVATAEFPIHSLEDAGDEAWHGFYVDLTTFVQAHAATGGFLVLEVRVACEKPLRDARGCTYQFQNLSLSVVTTTPKYQPKAPLFTK